MNMRLWSCNKVFGQLSTLYIVLHKDLKLCQIFNINVNTFYDFKSLLCKASFFIYYLLY